MAAVFITTLAIFWCLFQLHSSLLCQNTKWFCTHENFLMQTVTRNLKVSPKNILWNAGLSSTNYMYSVDDLLIIGASDSHECRMTLTIVMEIFTKLGLPLAISKLDGPTPCLNFLGFELDSRMLEIQLPWENNTLLVNGWESSHAS